MTEKVLRGKVSMLLFLFLFIVLLQQAWSASGALAASVGAAEKIPRAELSGRNEIPKIMSVLESRRPDKKVLEKAAEKMSEMNERDLRLMSLLSERISTDAGTPAADFAYSLLTALIVLS